MRSVGDRVASLAGSATTYFLCLSLLSVREREHTRRQTCQCLITSTYKFVMSKVFSLASKPPFVFSPNEPLDYLPTINANFTTAHLSSLRLDTHRMGMQRPGACLNVVIHHWEQTSRLLLLSELCCPALLRVVTSMNINA